MGRRATARAAAPSKHARAKAEPTKTPPKRKERKPSKRGVDAASRPSAAERARRHLKVVPDPTPRSQRGTDNRRLVILLLSTTAILVAIGFVMVLSSSSVAALAQYGSSFLFAWRQLIYIVLGAGALIVAARMPYRVWSKLGVPLLVVSIVLLGLVLHPAIGTVAGGSARWIEFGPVNIQPSEIAKLAVIACFATVLARRWDQLGDPRTLLALIPIVGVVAMLIMLQPDLGTTLVIVGSAFTMVFLAGVRLKWIAAAGAAGVAAGFALIFSSGYRRSRFLSFLDPWADPQNTGYHAIQSLLALGSGGWFGVGLGASRQKWLYVPNAHTDFIFAIIGEELGLIGASVVLALLGTLVFAAVRIAARAPDIFGRLLASGIAVWFGIQVLLNLGAVTGMLPITGVPIPLVSYGGSALLVTLTAIGVLVNVATAGSRTGAGKAATQPVSARRS